MSVSDVKVVVIGRIISTSVNWHVTNESYWSVSKSKKLMGLKDTEHKMWTDITEKLWMVRKSWTNIIKCFNVSKSF